MFTQAVVDFSLGEDPPQKALAPALVSLCDSFYFDYVDADSDDHSRYLSGIPFRWKHTHYRAREPAFKPFSLLKSKIALLLRSYSNFLELD